MVSHNPKSSLQYYNANPSLLLFRSSINKLSFYFRFPNFINKWPQEHHPQTFSLQNMEG